MATHLSELYKICIHFQNLQITHKTKYKFQIENLGVETSERLKCYQVSEVTLISVQKCKKIKFWATRCTFNSCTFLCLKLTAVFGKKCNVVIAVVVARRARHGVL